MNVTRKAAAGSHCTTGLRHLVISRRFPLFNRPRLDFSGYSGEGSLEPAESEKRNFNKLVSRESIEYTGNDSDREC
jgi:hypothetical protein